MTFKEGKNLKVLDLPAYVLQMLQWCALAGFGMMHFLQKDTEGIATLS